MCDPFYFVVIETCIKLYCVRLKLIKVSKNIKVLLILTFLKTKAFAILIEYTQTLYNL